MPDSVEYSPHRSAEGSGDAGEAARSFAETDATQRARGLSPARLSGNGRYFVSSREDGEGVSHAGNLRIASGFFIHVCDAENGACWRAPLGVNEANELETEITLAVCSEESAEVRRIALANRSRRRRTIEVTAHVEPVLSDPAAFQSHPSFSKLFIQTEATDDGRVLLARRRPRGHGETFPWITFAISGSEAVQYETDRARFFARGQQSAVPQAIAEGRALSGTAGNVLDPVLAIRRRIELGPGERAALAFVLGVAPERAGAIDLAARCTENEFVERTIQRAPHELLALAARHGLDSDDARRRLDLAAAILEGAAPLRAKPAIREHARGLEAARRERKIPAGHALAAALVERSEDAAAARALQQAGRFWEALGLPIVVLVLDEKTPPGERDALLASARLVVHGVIPEVCASAEAARRATTAEPLASNGAGADAPPAAARAISSEDRPARGNATAPSPAPEELRFFNGIGGFSPSGDEYVIRLRRDRERRLTLPPRPWVNVIANERFGFLVSETGASTMWSENSREHRLTPWSNDPLLDPHTDALYLRDDETGELWSPLPGPAPGPGDYEVRHGFGASVFLHASHGIVSRTEMFVPRHDSVRLITIALHNRTDRDRVISVASLASLVLGSDRAECAPFVVTERGPRDGTLLARNVRESDFAGRVAFAGFSAAGRVRHASATGDRAGFAGCGTMERPHALAGGDALDGRVGWDLEACFGQRITLELSPGEHTELSFVLGDAPSRDEAKQLLARFAAPEAIRRARDEIRAFWETCLGAVRIRTPSPALDLMVNGWLPYQTIACRMWARSALYQSGGAFGFRDQLQDASSLATIWPEATRAQILLHAAHQFVEGDVLHWWHPPADRGIRTRFADDLLWLPFLMMQYVATTGDAAVLDERAPFLKAPQLATEEDETYLLPSDSGTAATIYEHCCRAIDRSLGTGAHGLPLFGSGDWNDGMNRVGIGGKGESVWMGFFLVTILDAFAPVCAARGDAAREQKYVAHAKKLRHALNDGGWDGEWYRRGYFDDGAPLGSAASDECKIDALAQAWAVLSGVAPQDRAEQAMASVERHLVSEDDGLIRLLTPPFVNTPHDPGYIKGYVAGVRENGGQYTHAALWVVAAMAKLGRNDRVAPLLDLLNPILHARNAAEVAKYQVEPYVIAADVYGTPPHVGRGGWTWYTGSAGWMSRVALESLLGIRLDGGTAIRVKPCIPDTWPGFTAELRLPEDGTRVTILVENPKGNALAVTRASLDGRAAGIHDGEARVALPRDGGIHEIRVVLGLSRSRGPS